MAVFEYRGLVVATGKQVHGFRDADNPKVLRSALKREGVMLTSADLDKRGQGGKSRSGGGVFAFFRRIGPGDVAVMTRHLATLVSAGIPLVESMSRGTPVIVSDIPVFREVGEDVALYFAADDPSAFAAQVQPVLGDE